MPSIQSLVIIGSGNVATNMAIAFKDAGIDIFGVYSKTFENAQNLSNRLDIKAFKSISDIPANADAYLLAVTDSALSEIMKELPVFEGIVMHTSGSVGLDVFPPNQKLTAVFYPLQTFSKAKKVVFSLVPVLIESNDKTVLKLLQVLGKKISGNVKSINSKQRKQLHVAAVFACNFSNYMFHIAKELLDENDLDFNLLKPLINETIEKLNLLSPKEAQTGPAIRHDFKTLDEHLEILKEHPEYKSIYYLISDQIQKLKS